MAKIFESSLMTRDTSFLPLTDHETRLFGQLAFKAFKFSRQKKLVLPNFAHYPLIELVRVPITRAARVSTAANIRRRDGIQLALVKQWLGHLPGNLNDKHLTSLTLDNPQLVKNLIGMHLRDMYRTNPIETLSVQTYCKLSDNQMYKIARPR